MSERASVRAILEGDSPPADLTSDVPKLSRILTNDADIVLRDDGLYVRLFHSNTKEGQYEADLGAAWLHGLLMAGGAATPIHSERRLLISTERLPLRHLRGSVGERFITVWIRPHADGIAVNVRMGDVAELKPLPRLLPPVKRYALLANQTPCPHCSRRVGRVRWLARDVFVCLACSRSSMRVRWGTAEVVQVEEEPPRGARERSEFRDLGDWS